MAEKKPRIIKGKSVKDMNPCALVKQRNTQLRKMIAKTKTTGNEHAYSFCYDEKTGKLYPYGECSGDKCSIAPQYCPAFKEQAHIGINHTHPVSSAARFSIADVSVGFAARSDFDCLYSINAHEGKCITYKDKMTPQQEKDLTLALALEKQARSRGGLSDDGQTRLETAYENVHKVVGNKYCSYTLTDRTKKIPIKNNKDAGLWPATLGAITTRKRSRTSTSAADKVNCVYSVARNNIVYCLAMAFSGNKGQMCPFAEKNTGNKCPYGKPVPPKEFLKNMNGNLINAPAQKKNRRR